MGGDITVPECDGISVLTTGSGACPATATACLQPGEYFIFVGPTQADGTGAFSGNPCGNGVFNNYSMTRIYLQWFLTQKMFRRLAKMSLLAHLT
jgi:hypothetical protein